MKTIKQTLYARQFINALLCICSICYTTLGGAQSTLNGGSISNPTQSVTAGNISAQISASAASGTAGGGCDEFYQYQWEQSSDGVNFTPITGATTQNFQPPALNQTRHYRRRVTHCGTFVYTSNNATITVSSNNNSTQTGGCINEDTITIKTNTAPPTINATLPTLSNCNSSINYQWQISTDNVFFRDIAGATGQNFSYTTPITQTTFFQRRVKCGKNIKFTNSVTVYPVYTACADFGLSLAGTSGNALATIKAGLITTTTNSTIGEFVIEWYKDTVDNSPEFVSGSAGATDPAVTVHHPFNGEPAEGGTWHPVIKYVFIDGVKYSRNYIPGVRHSPDLLHCLDPIVVIVNNLSCFNGSTVYASNGVEYGHKITYNNTINSPSAASRSFRFELDSTNKYFAWNFRGFSVSDTMMITYVSPANGTSTLLENWKVGYDAGATNITANPAIWNGDNMYMIEPLTAFTYAPGDYLLIRIKPNSNSNTNWEFACKCLSSISCNIWDSTQRQILSTPVMAWDNTNCSWTVTYNKPVYTPTPNSIIQAYHYGVIWWGAGGGSYYDSKVTLPMVQRTDAYATYYLDHYGCAPLADSAQVIKTANALSFVFSNITDYNKYKSDFALTLNSPYMNDYSSDPTNYKHYKYWSVRAVIGNSCGDVLTSYSYAFHYESMPQFNDATKTVTWTASTKANGFAQTPGCDNVDNAVAGMLSTANNFPTNTYNTTTKVGAGSYFLSGIHLTLYPQMDTQKTFYMIYKIPKVDVCDLTSKGWTHQGLPTYDWQFVFVYDRVTITKNSDPERNFKLERVVDANGVIITNPSNYIKIYEIKEGVVQQ